MDLFEAQGQNGDCSEREKLQGQYLKAVNAFGAAVGDALTPECGNQYSKRKLTQHTSTACQYALKAFVNHIQAHGCNQRRTARRAKEKYFAGISLASRERVEFH